MLWAERAHRWVAIAAAVVWLCLALIGPGARASNSALPESAAMPAAAMTNQGVPAALDCMPRALCYIAPAPNLHVVTIEAKEIESFAWWTLDPPAPSERRFLTNPRCREHVPIRITFCRWLD